MPKPTPDTPTEAQARPQPGAQEAPIKSLGLSPALHRYLVEHGTPPDELLQELAEETRERVGGLAMMQIPPEEGNLLEFLVRLTGARRAIEVGTFTGYSALCIARGLPENGRLVCCDVSTEWTEIGRRYWQRAGVADKIDLRIAPALDTLAALANPIAHEAAPEAAAEMLFDFAFIDAQKTEYQGYLDLLHDLIRPGGLIVVDNVLWNGSVIDEDKQSEDTRAIRAFNDGLTRDRRFDRVMLGVGDGLTLLRKR